MAFDMNNNIHMLKCQRTCQLEFELVLSRALPRPGPGLHVPVPQALPDHEAFTPIWPMTVQCPPSLGACPVAHIAVVELICSHAEYPVLRDPLTLGPVKQVGLQPMP
jgi:hypothetical protein